ncbi:magnesium transporter MRS2-11, chloroplastic [Cucumis sativus]|uniref:magnesium transporter MRS2-11, chloroplastic n=1 Tax=Cucumis sativus TaxID=3659 RepID=UPI0012F4ADFE|nr:magnesium transporter MRS2-11, chloroplastic [Cucumis sativus]XP_031741505.1 magnesium transporter MRS2-11, chloroplastic [Cucumis sativus]XP_031741515.1 magnesium transporter MRS2-11, chloroplastic [Cucumis sativus]XP_031741526.1 magnesium transporter MRS2-11, chloroplastic [Cucumis sativus]XP_031741533.1 magnesium transporter MRS2-11, chloroplastic [Cucumis sativus]XP_031741541.1 magnesium transporter MRS2-11, chloroplastic [Cucumis sativus]XP_031741543.1 magnesium transporter MRS2-11, c
MALSLSLQLIRFPPQPPSPSSHLASLSRFFPSPCLSSFAPSRDYAVKLSSRTKCFSMSTEEDKWSESDAFVSDVDEGGDLEDDIDISVREDSPVATAASAQRISSSPSDYLSLAIREQVYEVLEVKANGTVSTRKVNRRQLLKSSGLRPRDVRSVDPSLFLTNSMPTLLVREHAILLNLGSLRAIAMQDCVLIFDHNRPGGQAFIESLLPRLNPKNMNGVPAMPFELEVVEAALLSRTQRLEQRLMKVEPRVQALLEVLPNKLTADVLEQLRISKQTLVELGSRAGALRQMLLDLLEDPLEIRRICIMGRNCTLNKRNDDVECTLPLDKQIADDEEEEIEMLLENYLQRCESCHGQAERLLDSAKEMEDSIAVNLSSRRLEVSRVELLLQVGTFCVAVGALVAGIFGMNLRSYLEEHVFAFWLTTAGIIVGAVVAFFLMYSYLRDRRIL